MAKTNSSWCNRIYYNVASVFSISKHCGLFQFTDMSIWIINIIYYTLQQNKVSLQINVMPYLENKSGLKNKDLDFITKNIFQYSASKHSVWLFPFTDMSTGIINIKYYTYKMHVCTLMFCHIFRKQKNSGTEK